MSKEFGNRIRQFREKSAMTQDKLATKIGVTVSTLNRWENGANFPRSGNIVNLAVALNISANDFLDQSISNQSEISEINKANKLQQKNSHARSDVVDKLTKLLLTNPNSPDFSDIQSEYITAMQTQEESEKELYFAILEENYKTVPLMLSNVSKYLTDIGLKRLHNYLYYCLLREEESTTDEYKELIKKSE